MPSAVNDIVAISDTQTDTGNVLLNDDTGTGASVFTLGGLVARSEEPVTITADFGTYAISASGTYTFTPFDWITGHRFFNSDQPVTVTVGYSFNVGPDTFSATLTHVISGANAILYATSEVDDTNPQRTLFFDAEGAVLYTLTAGIGTLTYLENATDAQAATGITSKSFTYTDAGQALSETTLFADGARSDKTYDFNNSEAYAFEVVTTDAEGNVTALTQQLDTGGSLEATFTVSATANVLARASEFDATGTLVAQETTFADERLVRTDLIAGTTEKLSITDQAADGTANARSWDTIVTEYLEGAAVQRTVTYDNTDEKITRYNLETGARSVSQTDGSGSEIWQTREKQFDAEGQFTGDHFVFDTGFVRTRGYFDDGSLKRQFAIDGANVKTWAQLDRVYDAAGDLMFVDQIKDNLDQIESTYATGGLLQTRTYTDFSETKNYYSRTYTYDGSGAIVETVTVEDGIFGG